MSTNCIRCVVNNRTGPDLLCDLCRIQRQEQGAYMFRGVKGKDTFVVQRWEGSSNYVDHGVFQFLEEANTFLSNSFAPQEIRTGIGRITIRRTIDEQITPRR